MTVSYDATPTANLDLIASTEVRAALAGALGHVLVPPSAPAMPAGTVAEGRALPDA